MTTDPVCGRAIDKTHWIASGFTRRMVAGKTVYFCGVGCRRMYLEDPEKYSQADRSGRSAVWPVIDIPPETVDLAVTSGSAAREEDSDDSPSSDE